MGSNNIDRVISFKFEMTGKYYEIRFEVKRWVRDLLWYNILIVKGKELKIMVVEWEIKGNLKNNIKVVGLVRSVFCCMLRSDNF